MHTKGNTMDIGACTDKGRLRENNEDSYFAEKDGCVFVVADGVGGQNAGEVASGIAAGEIAGYVKENLKSLKQGSRHVFDCMTRGILLANEKILEKSAEDEEMSHMATTAVTAVIRGHIAYISNVGDSRAYLAREGQLIKLTEDHTMANQLIREGRLTEEEIQFMAQKQIALNMFSTITKALGDKETVEPDHFFVDLEEEDILMLCTDGLYNEVSEEEILETLWKEKDMDAACRALVDKANAAGGRDNITVITIRIGE
ncbi:MAG: Stp1/IreP family PP2C-type Ser/Thr phosphatase [Firmicutes bacterium]|nr:Stp1/IreP family PP2C-type Ser/Thr phosphatase [Bacillota bacterium]